MHTSRAFGKSKEHVRVVPTSPIYNPLQIICCSLGFERSKYQNPLLFQVHLWDAFLFLWVVHLIIILFSKISPRVIWYSRPLWVSHKKKIYWYLSWTVINACSALLTTTLPMGNPWQATLNLKKSLISDYSLFKDYIKLIILYLVFPLQNQSPVNDITHTKEQNVKNFDIFNDFLLTYSNPSQEQTL